MRHFVTGAANGIGRVAVTHLLEQGHEVTAFDIDEEGLADLPDAVDTYQGDIRDEQRVHEVIKGEEFDVLVNNAGFSRWGAIEDMTAEEVEQHFAVNVYGYLHTVRAALPMLRENSGRIVNVSSLVSHLTAPYWGIYSASKHAVKAMSHELRMEVKPFGVDVVIVEPGPVTTGFNESGRDNVKKYLPDTHYAEGYREKLDVDSFGGVTPEKAGRVLAEAATTSGPSYRYRVGWQAKLFPKLRVLLPEPIWDRVVQRFS
jgi:NAD(P)-dependent dehydrogenase (short-subunit alcohol dehydrogenase family)